MASTYERNGIIWGKVQRKGKTLRRSLKTRDQRIADQRLDAWVKELDSSGNTALGEQTVRQAIDRFTLEHLPTLKPKAIRRYYTSSAWVLQHFGSMKLNEVRSKQMYEFEQWRKKMRYRGKRISIVTIKRDLAFLSSVMSEAEVWEWYDRNPVKAYIRGRANKGVMVESDGRERYLSHEEEAKLLAAEPADVNPDDLQMVLGAIAFAIETGLRAEEQWALGRQSFNFARQRVFVAAQDAKSSKSRWVPLQPRSIELMQRFAATNHPFMFWRYDHERIEHTWVWRIFQKIVAAAGLEDLEWHDLRRTCGCRLLQDHGMSMERVSRWLGHSSIKVTEKHYAFLRVEDLESALHKSQNQAIVPTPTGTGESGLNGHNPSQDAENTDKNREAS